MKHHTRTMWQPPWRYRESIAFVAGIVIVGMLLQLTTGEFAFDLLRYPVNLILGAGIVVIVAMVAVFRRNPVFGWFTGVPLSVTLIASLLLLGIIMGLTPQASSPLSGERFLASVLGFDRMTHSWPFVLVYLTILLSLGGLIVKRLIPFRKRDYGFYLNHIGLWLLLFASGLGAADMERYLMKIYEGEVEWRATDSRNHPVELPIAVELNDFYMEEYPPGLTVIDRQTGNRMPEEHPEFLPLDVKRPKGMLFGWEIELKSYIHDAVRNSDSTYHEVHMPGSSPAAYVSAYHPQTGERRTGWVCPGNVSQLYMVLNLDSAYCIAATRPEPKRFVSDIRVYRKGEGAVDTQLEVNKPYRAGAWMIYQHGYDNLAGKMSNFTTVELVYDPWLPAIYIGIGMLAAGSVCMLWLGNRTRRKEEENA